MNDIYQESYQRVNSVNLAAVDPNDTRYLEMKKVLYINMLFENKKNKDWQNNYIYLLQLAKMIVGNKIIK